VGAKVLGQSGELGVVAPGALADLLVAAGARAAAAPSAVTTRSATCSGEN
jgi:imidazolonepropionase-like amidohydrolase